MLLLGVKSPSCFCFIAVRSLLLVPWKNFSFLAGIVNSVCESSL